MAQIELIHGDCLIEMQKIPDKSVDMILCDPPYGTTACKWDSVIPFEPMWEQLKRIIKPNGAICLLGSEPFSSALRMSNIKHYKYAWVWDKVTAREHLVVKYRPMQQTENISVFGYAKVNYYPIKINRPQAKIKTHKHTEYKRTSIMGGISNAPENKTYDQWYPKNIIQISNAFSSHNSLHPTQKPVALLEYLIKTYTQENETVLDFCSGSASTAIACLNTNRKGIMIEKDEHYFNVGKKRVEEHIFNGTRLQNND